MKRARERKDLRITPQRLREWFCCEMAALGVSNTCIDTFCGRNPKTVLARHYIDHSPEKQKMI
jgi:intergrase/recombinase